MDLRFAYTRLNRPRRHCLCSNMAEQLQMDYYTPRGPFSEHFLIIIAKTLLRLTPSSRPDLYVYSTCVHH